MEIPRHMMENGLEIRVGEGGEEGGDGDVGSREGFLVINPLERSGKVEDQVTFSYLQLEQQFTTVPSNDRNGAHIPA